MHHNNWIPFCILVGLRVRERLHKCVDLVLERFYDGQLYAVRECLNNFNNTCHFSRVKQMATIGLLHW